MRLKYHVAALIVVIALLISIILNMSRNYRKLAGKKLITELVLSSGGVWKLKWHIDINGGERIVNVFSDKPMPCKRLDFGPYGKPGYPIFYEWHSLGGKYNAAFYPTTNCTGSVRSNAIEGGHIMPKFEVKSFSVLPI